MTADILSDPTHPHGTTEGLRLGCRTVHCPAPVSCREVHYLYHGDLAFRRAIDAGLTPSEALAKAKAQPETPRSPKGKTQAAPAADPASLIAALGELPADAEFMAAEKTEIANGFGHAYRKTASMTFRRRATDA